MPFTTTLHPLPNNRLLAEGTLADEAALNALSPQMVREMRAALHTWQSDARIALILLRGAGRHFCAGGNIREITQHIRAQEWRVVADFFQSEYKLDASLYHYPKPTIAWGNGAVMGGGMGVLQGCALRLLASDAKVAMPEVHIGLFPDVGAAWFLRRCPPPLGLFLGITGATISAQDAHHANLADVVVPADAYDTYRTHLCTAEWSGDATQDLTQARHLAEDTAERKMDFASPLASAQEEITYTLTTAATANNPAAIISALANSSNEWLQKIATRAATASPAAIAHWHHHWQATEGKTQAEIFAADYRAIMAFSRDPQSEFTEGVRALVIDKDKNPKWQHPTIESVPKNWLQPHPEDEQAATKLQAEIEAMA